MKAAVIRKYGGPDTFRIEEVPERGPKAGEIKVRNVATSINPIDFKARKGYLFVVSGFRFPKILGADFAGVVEACGAGVRNFKPGDEVYGFTAAAGGKGALAESLCCKASVASAKPTSLDFEQAAALPLAASTAYRALTKEGGLTAGMRVLVVGATGGVGHFAVQIARISGAHVTGVCRSSGESAARELGCIDVIAYDRTDFRRSGQTFDLIFDAAGKYGFGACRALLTAQGTYVTTIPGPSIMLRRVLTASASGRKARFVAANSNDRDLSLMRQWCDEGRLKPLIDAVFPLEETRQAFERAESGRTRGKVVIRTGETSGSVGKAE
ncbi:NAD(P)-dependent alcohol dehydrogenase [Saccharibacillus sp. CPCC 101409]|uniref:NAD(P)-dependent alcohol dehydrogenase n=1 Tax=Saccharibacillus sp. CPCC 101409 TaxID=3058041 RepID=UPI0026739044|nr:NAD(P)-dependent alcohol dehydrogenase [Saccharibacillus sp. CPCC 101409]MDO3408458.1 NAD(P)-dependent alcohol dehydrogenase [Saccharibacillus sp. CPCC 101409]